MDKTALVENDIQLGATATEALQKSKDLRLRASLWLYYPESSEWRLLLATPVVDRKGPLEAYTRIQRALEKTNLARELPLHRVAAVSPKDPLIRALLSNVKTGPGLARIRLTHNVIDDVFIDEALIYHLN